MLHKTAEVRMRFWKATQRKILNKKNYFLLQKKKYVTHYSDTLANTLLNSHFVVFEVPPKIISLTEMSSRLCESSCVADRNRCWKMHKKLDERRRRDAFYLKKERKLDRHSSLTNYRGTHVHPFAYSVINLRISLLRNCSLLIAFVQRWNETE